MYLKALEIQGFKSFPDKTVLNFGEDLTAIVGPNGSGKSNISDAIRWVMGEQSAKGLRGNRMEDVIFGGTAKRRQVGFAQVTLVLDNTARIFPSMEESEVSVTRRFYRSGESEYYINRQSVRLRDVTELFMDTGLGREGYSIIGQGKIDEILSAKSGERREIFEEAAGISRFRHRKEEAERKLERTDENLVRVNDKAAELELQVEPLRAQAETAKRYLLLRDELRLLEISVWLSQLEALKAAGRQLEEDLQAAQAERDGAREALDAVYAQGEALGEAMREKDLETEQARSDAAALEGLRRDQEAAVAVLENGIAHQRENIRRGREELESAQSRAGDLSREAREAEDLAREIEGRMTERSAAMEDLLQRARDTAQQAGGAQSEAERLREQEAAFVSAAAEAKAEAAAVEAESGQLESRRAAASQDRRDMEQRLEDTARQAEETKAALDQAREAAQSAANAETGRRMRLEQRQRLSREASERRVKLTMDVGAADNRIRLLTDMEREYEGFSRAVKAVMHSNGRLGGIHGPVAELMKTDKQYALAIEIALGAALQNIVVDREEDAKSAIEYLKRQDAGRATFLPLTAIRGEELRERSVDQEPGFVGLASRLVSFDAQYTGIFRNLLGRTVVVEDLDRGIAMARRYRNAFRIVTLDGQVIHRGGSMTGGSVSRGTGVLSRKAELETLRGQADALHQELEEAKRSEESAARDAAAAQYALDTAQSERRQAEDRVLRLEESQKHLDQLLPSLRQSLGGLDGELEALERHLEENLRRRQELEAAIKDRETEAAARRAQAEAALAGQSELLAASGALAEEITAAREALASLTAERDGALQRAEDLRKLSRDLSGGREEKEAVLRGYEAEIAKAEADIAARKAEAEDLERREGDLRRKLEGLIQEKLDLERRRTAQNKESQEKNEHLLDLERSAARLEQKASAGALEQKQILDRLWESYELNYTDASAQRVEIPSMAKANRRIHEIKREVHGLGSINLGAIEEFDRVNARYTYLTDQRDDIQKAKVELEGIIAEITGQMTIIFAQQFKLLSESFEKTFVELFGGGAARLELEDEKDVLNCGIEIKAQPPGKTLKTISLLSGGEKAFVAIALYFSILKVHPTPFCVMDEIEAALDDVNVTRYARYMRTLTEKTQFIVITHRRGTMEEADVLYGVTMQEQGISKILTINLNDVAKDLKIE